MKKELTKSKHSSIILITLLVLILLSSMETSIAFKPDASSVANINYNTETVSNSDLIVTTHSITTEEIQKLKGNLGINEGNQDNNELIDGHGTGLSAPTSEEWSSIAQTAEVVDQIFFQSTQSVVDNSATQYFPPIGNQDGEGSCVAWAVGYYVKTYQEAKEHSWDLSGAKWIGGTYGSPTASYQNMIISPDFIYHLTNGGSDSGTSFEAAIRLVSAIGASSWVEMPYNPLDSTSWPSEAAWIEAALYRCNSTTGYQYLYANTEEGITNLKNWLSAGNLAVIAVDAEQYDNLSSNDLWTLDNYKTIDLNHANTIVGYNDSISYIENGILTYGAFKIANSWGIGGGWENVDDGFYWISYEAMKQLSDSSNPCIIFYDLIDYQPELTASFQINHSRRGECNITLGLGTASNQIITKSLKSYIIGGDVAFCSNNIVIDITEFKQYITNFYNQSFFIKIYDTGSPQTGNLIYYAVEDSASTGTPIATLRNTPVYLTVNYSLGTPSLNVSPTKGFANEAITIEGTYFTANSTVHLSYLDLITTVWIPIASNIQTSQSGNFTYSLNAPDLKQINPAGDNPATYDNIIFAAVDNSSGYIVNSSNVFAEERRGLTSINNINAIGLFGNNTDLSSTLRLQVGQQIVVCGSSFSSGAISAYFDDTIFMGSGMVDENGNFNASFTIPTQCSPMVHTITIRNSEATLLFNITILPQIFSDYDGNWHSNDYYINLYSNGEGISEIKYILNGGETKNVVTNGQPQIISEGAYNLLEYWGIWSDGNVSIELTHVTLTEIKLDKTAPEASLEINNNELSTESTSVKLTISASDLLSGVQKIRVSNDGIWNTETWQSFRTQIDWILTSGNGVKHVYCQIMDNAGLIVNVESSIILAEPNLYESTPQVTDTSSPTPSNVTTIANEDETGIVPEYSGFWIVILLSAMLFSAVFSRKSRKK